jgi:hypothetical protein
MLAVVKTKDLTLKQVLSVPCPTCDAAAEEPCAPHPLRKHSAATSKKDGTISVEAILDEVEHLNSAGVRIERLAAHHLPVSDALVSIAGSVRATATVLAVLLATKLQG